MRIRARVKSVSVRKPACQPVNERAGQPRSRSAIASSAIVTCSPVATSMSCSRASGLAAISWESRSSRSVSPLIAETTTATRFPLACAPATRRATFLMRSGDPTEVPPNFLTMSAMRSSPEK